jgi:hypothetical protein
MIHTRAHSEHTPIRAHSNTSTLQYEHTTIREHRHQAHPLQQIHKRDTVTERLTPLAQSNLHKHDAEESGSTHFNSIMFMYSALGQRCVVIRSVYCAHTHTLAVHTLMFRYRHFSSACTHTHSARTRTLVHRHARTQTHARAHTHSACAHTHACTHTRACAQTRARTHARVRAHTHARAKTHTRVRAHTRAQCTHTQTRSASTP